MGGNTTQMKPKDKADIHLAGLKYPIEVEEAIDIALKEQKKQIEIIIEKHMDYDECKDEALGFILEELKELGLE